MCHEAGQSAFLHSYTVVLMYESLSSYLAMSLGTNSRSVLMCHKTVNQSIDSANCVGTLRVVFGSMTVED